MVKTMGERGLDIYKVRLTTVPGKSERHCAIYNYHGLIVEGPADIEIELAMQGASQLYFVGWIEDGKVVLDAITEKQPW